MAVTQIGNITDTSGLHLQPGATLSSTKAGVTVYQATYCATHTQMRNLLNTGYFYINRPNETYTSLWLTQYQILFDEGKYAFATTTFEGVLGENLPDPVVEVIRGVSQEPIETHKDFVAVIGGTATNDKNNAKFDDDGNFQNFPPDAPNELGGVRSFLDSTVTVRQITVSFNPPSGFETVPTIDTPPNAPPAGYGRNWLKVGISYVKRGPVYEITEEWTRSGFRGWNTLIYPS